MTESRVREVEQAARGITSLEMEVGDADDGSLLPSRKIEIHSLENLHSFGSVSIGFEKLLNLNQLFQTIASLVFSMSFWERSSFI